MTTTGTYATMRRCIDEHYIELLRDEMHTYDVGRPADGQMIGLPGLEITQDAKEDCPMYPLSKPCN